MWLRISSKETMTRVGYTKSEIHKSESFCFVRGGPHEAPQIIENDPTAAPETPEPETLDDAALVKAVEAEQAAFKAEEVAKEPVMPKVEAAHFTRPRRADSWEDYLGCFRADF